MLLNPFNAIKQQLADVPDIKLITWYNDQVKAGVLHTEPVILIEFPDELNTETLNRQSQQAGLLTRVHVIHKLHTDKDGSIKQNIMQLHEDAATAIFDRLHEFAKEGPNGTELSSNERIAYRLDMDNPGWAITTQDFDCLLYQPVVSSPYAISAKPGPKIIPDNSRHEFITVTMPEIGSVWIAGETYQITWDQFLLSGDVAIYLINPDGTQTTISANADCGSFAWAIPKDIEPDNNYKIRVISNDNLAIFGDSAKFEVAAPGPLEYITVTTPNGGELWLAGSLQTIRWDMLLNSGGVKIELFDGKTLLFVIAVNAPGNFFTWNITPNIPIGDKYIIKVTSNDNPLIYDQSDNYFSIINPKK